jgi:Flp pilus assembly protein TadG
VTWRIGPRRILSDDLGQSLVEISLSLPLLVFLLIGGVDIGRAFAVQLAVQNGARAGAEASALDYTPTNGEAATHAQQEMNRTPGMDAGTTCTNSGNVYTCGSATITITRAKFDGSACPATPGIDGANACYFKVRVQYTWRTIIPWPGIPNVFNIDRSTLVRVFW